MILFRYIFLVACLVSATLATSEDYNLESLDICKPEFNDASLDEAKIQEAYKNCRINYQENPARLKMVTDLYSQYIDDILDAQEDDDEWARVLRKNKMIICDLIDMPKS